MVFCSKRAFGQSVGLMFCEEKLKMDFEWGTPSRSQRWAGTALIVVAAGILLLVAAFDVRAQSSLVTLCVSESGTFDSGDCDQEFDALSTALDAATTSPTQIWIASGTYLPDTTGLTDSRDATFPVPDGVAILGGFPASGGELASRDPEVNPTILSGDIGIANDADDNAYTVVTIEEDTEVTIDGVTITGGNADSSTADNRGPERNGGGVYSSGSLTLTNVVISGNSADDGRGGGVFVPTGSTTVVGSRLEFNRAGRGGGAGVWGGELEINDSSISDNEVDFDGGGLTVQTGFAKVVDSGFVDNQASNGGAIHLGSSQATVEITGSLISENEAKGNNGGGVRMDGGKLEITDSTVTENYAERTGGGLSLGSGTVKITESIVSQNSAIENGGGVSSRIGISENETLSISDSTLDDNQAALGAGVYLYPGSKVEIVDTTVSNNGSLDTTDYGGAFYVEEDSSLTIQGSRIDGNAAETGGGLYVENAPDVENSPAVMISDSVIMNNDAEYGGGFYNFRATVRIKDSTISGNTATITGGGISSLEATRFELENSTVSGNTVINGNGGGLYVSGTFVLTNSTISGNTAASGGGIYLNLGSLDLTSSTVGSNTATGGDGGGIYNGATLSLVGSLVAGNVGQSISGDLAFTRSYSLTIDSQILGPLQDNGGPTQTMMPLPGSVAIDIIPVINGECEVGSDVDQRGVERPVGLGCDLGAVEVAPAPSLNLPGNFTVNFNQRNSVTWSASATDWTGSSNQVVCSPVSGSSFTVGQTTVQCEAIDSLGQSTSGSFVVTVLTEQDPKPPSFRNFPSDIVVPSDGPDGTVVDYAMPSAVDQTDGDVPVTCDPPPGALFGIGHNTVTCSATNSLNLTATRAFAIIVMAYTGGPDQPDFTPVDDPENPWFWATWARTDLPVRDGNVSRTWMWGPGPFTGSMWEPYTTELQGDGDPVFLSDLPETEREVIYFDKARMEINDPGGDTDSLWYVTNGLLVVEMITGNRQFGDDLFKQYEPSTSNVAGDSDGTTGPTYAALQNVLDEPAQSVGTLLTQEIDRNGVVTENAQWGEYGLTVGFVDEVTNHGIAGPFWEFMQSEGLVHEDGDLIEEALFENPFYATGRPITEAYWATVPVDGEPRDVLLQCFERRCLTWTPGNDPGFVIEAGNVGQHYFTWRYVQQLD
ncbi:MAG: HYR domain-containing protein [Sphaerobacteraceae bacterium]|nr:MAG: HYR domain-containing protein [Sphaerobacteraceae bacterium]